MISSRFVKFIQSLVSCSKPSVQYLANISKDENRTLMGRTLSRISREIKIAKAELSSSCVNKSMSYLSVPDDNQWRINIIHELLDTRSSSLSLPNFNPTEIKVMLDYLCTS